MDVIFLEDFAVTCIIGILPRERVTPQTVEVGVRMELDLSGAAGGDLSKSVDYAAVRDQVDFLCTEGKWWLLESLSAAAARLILSVPGAAEQRARVQRVWLKFRKPDVLGDLATPGIEITRDVRQATCPTRREGPVVIEVLQATDKRVAERIHLDPGATWTARGPIHIIAGDVDVNGSDVTNNGSVPATLVHIDVCDPA